MDLWNGFVETMGLRNGFEESTKNGCGGMQSNRVEFEQEKMEGMTKLEGTSDEAGFEQMGLSKQIKEGRGTEHSPSRGRDEDGDLTGEDELQVACACALSQSLSFGCGFRKMVEDKTKA